MEDSGGGGGLGRNWDREALPIWAFSVISTFRRM